MSGYQHRRRQGSLVRASRCGTSGVFWFESAQGRPANVSIILDTQRAFIYLDHMELVELGATIRRARLASGISQAQMARMAGVSRATINYAETGRSAIGADALLRILPPLGLSIAPTRSVAGRADRPAVELLATSASVSFKETIPAAEVERALVTGTFADPWLPHIAAIIDEASTSLLLRAVREIAAQTSLPAATIWRNLRSLAQTVSSPNTRWA